MSEAEARSLYASFVQARRQVGASGVPSYDSLMSSLRKRAPSIMSKHRAGGVEFSVSVKENRVVVTAKPKKPQT